MTVWLVHRGVSGWYVGHPDTRINLETSPAPTVGAVSIFGDNRSHYWLEDDEVPMAVLYDQRNPSGYAGGHRQVNLETHPAPTVMAHGIGGDTTSAYALIDNGLPVPLQPTSPNKPPYHVPLMTEIATIPKNGYSVASTFSGGGGSCTGYAIAGFRVVWASEFVPAAIATYRANYPDVLLDTRDIRLVTAQDIFDATGIAYGALDLLDGSPPCQAFSTAGKREAGWGKVNNHSDGNSQRSDDLFFEYARLVRDLQPRTFVAENVSGLVKGTAKGYFKLILAALRAAGYRVEARLLDAQWLGVPQARQRLIFVGVRNDLGLDPAFPTPFRYRYSVRDAIPWLAGVRPNTSYIPTMQTSDKPSPTITASNPIDVLSKAKITGRLGTGYQRRPISLDRPIPTITASGDAQTRYEITGAAEHVIEPESRMDGYAVGPEWDKLAPGQSSDRYFSLIRPHPDAPSPTVMASSGFPNTASVTHPTERRKFSIEELKRICAFPDDYILTGSYSEQWARLGNAVPPPMMAAIATTIRHDILDRIVRP